MLQKIHYGSNCMFPIIMNNSFKNKNPNDFKSQKFDWSLIQEEMKNKLGTEIYESWLKRLVL